MSDSAIYPFSRIDGSSESTSIRSSLLENRVKTGLRNGFVNLRFGTARGYPTQKLPIDLNRQPSLIWEKFRECQRFHIAFFYRVCSVSGRLAVESRMARLSLGKLN